MLVSAVEHASVAGTARWLAGYGLVKLDVSEVTSGGFVEQAAVEEMLSDDVVLVSVMAANSETGVLNPVGGIAELTHAAGALFHCDATQMAGRLPFNMDELGVDLVSLSGITRSADPAGWVHWSAPGPVSDSWKPCSTAAATSEDCARARSTWPASSALVPPPA